VGGDECLLERVLGLVARPEHVAAVGQDRCVVAVVEDLERGLIAAAHLRDQALVAECGQELS
jgi:hypothetical protein